MRGVVGALAPPGIRSSSFFIYISVVSSILFFANPYRIFELECTSALRNSLYQKYSSVWKLFADTNANLPELYLIAYTTSV